MSILSKLLKKAVGIPEVNINKLPFANKIVGDWENKAWKILLNNFQKKLFTDLSILVITNLKREIE